MSPPPAGPGLLLIAGLACLTIGACFFIAFLITATRAALSRAGRSLANHIRTRSSR